MKSAIVKGMAAAMVMAAAGQASAIDKNWNVRSGNWNTGTNWFTNGAPGPADNVFIGNTAAAFNGGVNLNVDAAVASVTITDGMMLRTLNNRLATTGDTVISGENQSGDVIWSSRVQVNNGPNASDYVTRAMTVSDGAELHMDGGRIDLLGLLQIDATGGIYGWGEIRLGSNAATAMRVDGFLQAGVEGLVINQMGSGRIDLDGAVVEADKDINLSTAMIDGSAFAHLTINGDALTDAYDEQFTIVEGGYLTMNLSEGWAMGPASTMRFTSYNNDSNVAEVNGTALAFDGTIELASSCTGHFNCPITLGVNSDGIVGNQDRLHFNNLATVAGGAFTVEAGGQITFNGATVMHGGMFSGTNDVNALPPVSFNATTEWDGTVTLNGRSRMNNTATVSGTTVINAGRFDMDGVLNNSVWNVNSSLTVNAASLSESGYFHGTFNVGGGLASRLTVNLTSGLPWPMNGTMNLSGLGELTVTRLAGTPMAMQGQLNVSGRVVVAAGCLLQSSTAFAGPTSELRMMGVTQVEESASFAGGGTLHVLPPGTLQLFPQVNMGTSPLWNEGRMWISDLAASAVVPKLTLGTTSRWDVQIAGNGPGELHDTLYVTGAGSVIDGEVEVELLANQGDQFVPQVGDSFLILDARQGYAGTFDNLPTSIVGSVVVDWSFRYTPTQVFVEVAGVINRCPADFNNDGFVDFFDYDAFVLCFETGECPSGKTADFNGDDFVDFFDYDAYVLAFESGC